MSADLPLVSVVMAAYQAERHLAAALASLHAQSYRALEIIVVDDGSTDGTARILARAAQERGVRIFRQANSGQSAALNRGLREARGPFIKFFDSDDLLGPDTLAAQVDALRARPRHLAYAPYARFHTDPAEAVFTPRPGWHDSPPLDWLLEIFAEGEPMMQCAQFLIPRALLDEVGGWDERLGLINDFEFFTRLVLASDGLVFTPAARLFYRSGLPGSLSGQRSAAAWASARLSVMQGTRHLLAREDSPRTRLAAATILQAQVHSMYPAAPSEVALLEARVRELGGAPLRARGGRAFLLLSRLLGWKAARRLQVLAGKFPRA